MEEWKKTTCVLCGNLCGLEVLVENNRILKARGDKDNPRSEGYVCRKGLNIRYYQHHAERLTHPLKRVGNTFEKISWEQAIEEVAEKLSAIVGEHGPRSLALMMGNGNVGCPSQGAFAVNVLRGLGSQYFYSALAQELTGRFWVDGKTFGNQHLHTVPDLDATDMLLAVGWNPMVSHHTPQARRVFTKISKDPNKLLVVVDPRKSETARIANMHLAIRPGTDALFYRAMITIILTEGWHDRDYIEKHVRGLDAVRSWFTDFDAKSALDICALDYEQVKEICRLFTTRKSSHHSDLGVLMNRHSTLVSYLQNVLVAICGRIGMEGGNVFPVGLRGGGGRKRETPDEREARLWRTVASDYPAITGTYPPNVMPEEIMTDHPKRLRTVIVSGTNPLRSFADTSAYEEAFKRLDLLVTVDITMTETAAVSHYVLPALSAYESWDGGVEVIGDFPGLFLQMRRPVVEPVGEQIEAGEIFLRLADRLGLVPDIPEALYETADKGDRLQFGTALMEFLQHNPGAGKGMPYILAKTLGKKLGSGHLGFLWGLLQNLPPAVQEMAARMGFHPGPGLGEEVFQAVLKHPEGLWVGQADRDHWDHFQALDTKDGRINMDVPEMADWIQELDPALESERLQEGEDVYPFIMSSGRHMDYNANTQMRDPAWNQGKRACTALMHTGDAEKLGFSDGQTVKVTTEAGEEKIELQVTKATRPGYIMIPHGFGLVYQGDIYGANANRLSKSTHRDRIAGTPLHRYIRCRVEAL
ncbi:MAG: molybdopterin-dependent oxidoreductase [Deltaproteobacteria bacterium]|nr:molybdopterin-dependent oxidoreductase [Deltaproteobacteria bacterium]